MTVYAISSNTAVTTAKQTPAVQAVDKPVQQQAAPVPPPPPPSSPSINTIGQRIGTTISTAA